MTSPFEGENMQIRYNVLGYRMNLYFREYKLVPEADENNHSDRNIDSEIKRKNAIGQELDCEFIRTGPNKEDVISLKLSRKYLGTSNNPLIN